MNGGTNAKSGDLVINQTPMRWVYFVKHEKYGAGNDARIIIGSQEVDACARRRYLSATGGRNVCVYNM